MQSVTGLARYEMKRIGRGGSGAEPFVRFEPSWMRRAIIVAEAGNALGIKLDSAGWCGKPVLVRIRAKFAKKHVLVGATGDFREALLPESIEIRDGHLVGANLAAPALVKVAQPPHLIAAFRVGAFAAEPTRQIGEDRKVTTGLADRLDSLPHGEHIAIAVSRAAPRSFLSTVVGSAPRRPVGAQRSR